MIIFWIEDKRKVDYIIYWRFVLITSSLPLTVKVRVGVQKEAWLQMGGVFWSRDACRWLLKLGWVFSLIMWICFSRGVSFTIYGPNYGCHQRCVSRGVVNLYRDAQWFLPTLVFAEFSKVGTWPDMIYLTLFDGCPWRLADGHVVRGSTLDFCWSSLSLKKFG